LVKLTVESTAYGKGGKVTINFRTAGLRELCNGGLTPLEQTSRRISPRNPHWPFT
jgi:hypothetical protein